MKRYGLTQKESEIACSRYLVGDDEWSVEKKKTGFETKKKKKVKTGFEMEPVETPEAKEKKAEKKRKITPAGAKAVKREPGRARPIKTTPMAFQMPLFQPWRAPKSEHRLQTKLEKVITAEQAFLTMEQLMKRAQYAVAIKKRDSDDYMFMINQIVRLCEEFKDVLEEDAGRPGSGRRMKSMPTFTYSPAGVMTGMKKKGGEEPTQWITTKTGKKVPITEPEGREKTEPVDVIGMLEKVWETRKETPTVAESRSEYRRRMGKKPQVKSMVERYLEHKEKLAELIPKKETMGEILKRLTPIVEKELKIGLDRPGGMKSILGKYKKGTILSEEEHAIATMGQETSISYKKYLFKEEERELNRLKRIPESEDPNIKQKVREQAGKITKLDKEIQKTKIKK